MSTVFIGGFIGFVISILVGVGMLSPITNAASTDGPGYGVTGESKQLTRSGALRYCSSPIGLQSSEFSVSTIVGYEAGDTLQYSHGTNFCPAVHNSIIKVLFTTFPIIVISIIITKMLQVASQRLQMR